MIGLRGDLIRDPTLQSIYLAIFAIMVGPMVLLAI